MGQAKRRGSAQERTQQAQERGGLNQRTLFDAISSGAVQHYCFVFDRSERGRFGMDSFERAPDELGDRAKSSTFQQMRALWEAETFPYLSIWGSFGYTGGLTLPAATDDVLLNEALPRIVERNAEKGGLCVYLFAVEERLRVRMAERLAALEAEHGLQSQVVSPAEAQGKGASEEATNAANHQGKGLLDLALAPTGRQVDMNLVQILDQKAFGEIASSMMLLASQSLSKKKALREKDLELQGWAQDDGRLFVHAPLPGGKYKVITIAQGAWRELEARAADALLEELETEHAKNPAERETLIDVLAGQMQSHRDAWEKAREELDVDKTGFLVACTKSATALARLRDITDYAPEWLPYVETWLASSDEVLALYTRPDVPQVTLSRLERQEDLLNGFLEHSAEQIGSNVKATLLICADVREDVADLAQQRWRDLGGKA